mgnify:FL=1
MLEINPTDLSTKDLHGYLLSSVGPRPIALVSTIDNEGRLNLSPYSFFNVFSANPPIAIFSPARRIRNNTTKHTLQNAALTNEVVINVVSFPMVEQTSLSSTEYKKGVNEFIKSGLTPIESTQVKPYRVKESPVQMECKVKNIISLGEEGGAGNLVVCEIIKMHISEDILNSHHQIDPNKIDLVGRMGANWYCRASNSSLFEVQKPNSKIGIGYNQLPDHIRNSDILSGNDLAKLANVESIPSMEDVKKFKENKYLVKILKSSVNKKKSSENLHYHCKKLLQENKVLDAWCTLLIENPN